MFAGMVKETIELKIPGKPDGGLGEYDLLEKEGDDPEDQEGL